MQANWVLFVRIFGLFEALVVLLIVLGENLGGIFYVLSLIFEVFFLLWPKIAAQKLNVWNFSELSEVEPALCSSPTSPSSSELDLSWPPTDRIPSHTWQNMQHIYPIPSRSFSSASPARSSTTALLWILNG
jgi:hypothetical protein